MTQVNLSTTRNNARTVFDELTFLIEHTRREQAEDARFGDESEEVAETCDILETFLIELKQAMDASQ